MLIGVVSDTHGRTENARRAAVMLESLHVEKLIHCGDIDEPTIPPIFAAWETHYVRGNNDHDEFALRRAIKAANGVWHGPQGTVTWNERKITFLHGDNSSALRAASRDPENALVCYGHTHEYDLQKLGETLVLNPGALFRASRHTFALVDLQTMEIHCIEVPRE